MGPDPGADPARKLAEKFNYLPITVFCLWLAPVISLWVKLFWPHPPVSPPPVEHAPAVWLTAALVGGGLMVALPRGWFNPRSFESELYRALRIAEFRRIATNGGAIILAVRRRFPGFTVYRGDLEKLLSNTRLGESSHLGLFVFGLITTIYMLVIGWYAWAMWTAATNVVGNLYPVMLQRYTRARLSKIRRVRR